LLVSGGASLEMIGKLLGHSQMQTTLRYAHLMDLPLRAGVDAVASAFRPKPGWSMTRIDQGGRKSA
jgi:integrase